MIRMHGLFLLMLSMPWLAQAAALKSEAGDQIAHSTSSDGYSTKFRLQVISMLYPGN